MKNKAIIVIAFLPILFSFHAKEKNLVTLKTGWYYVTEDRSGTSRLLGKTTQRLLIDTVPILTVKDIKEVKVVKQDEIDYVLRMQFNDNAKERWRIATGNSIGKQLAFILDDELISAPFVRSEIPVGACSIFGGSKQELLKIKDKIEKEMRSAK